MWTQHQTKELTYGVKYTYIITHKIISDTENSASEGGVKVNNISSSWGGCYATPTVNKYIEDPTSTSSEDSTIKNSTHNTEVSWSLTWNHNYGSPQADPREREELEHVTRIKEIENGRVTVKFFCKDESKPTEDLIMDITAGDLSVPVMPQLNWEENGYDSKGII